MDDLRLPGLGNRLSQRNRPYLSTTLDPDVPRNKKYVVPSATQNAVTGAAAAQGTELSVPAYPTDYRRGYDSATAALPLAPHPTVLTSGPVSGMSPDAGQPYPDNTPFANKVPTSAARASFLDGTPDMPGGMRGVPSNLPAESSGGAGLFAPGFSSQVSDLQSRGAKLLDSSSIVDNWRGRQLLKASARLTGSATSIAGAVTGARNADAGAVGAQASLLGARASAMRASNEVPLAQLADTTQRRGQNIQFDTAAAHDAAVRYGTDTDAASRKYATDAGLAAHLPTIQREQAVNDAISSGNLEGAEEVARIGRYAPLPRQPSFHPDVSGEGGLMISADGTQKYISFKDMRLDAKAKEKEADKRRLATQVK